MKIGILTYHACLNYGACLQAYALQTSIKKKYSDCRIINYQSDILREISDVFCRRPKHPKEIVKNITRIPYAGQLGKRQKYFEYFYNEVLEVTDLCRTDAEVQKQANEFDCIVCGSDQIWNMDPAIRYETPLYFLNFPKKQRRISYAASFGPSIKTSIARENEFLPWLKEFDRILVREENGQEYLKSKGIESTITVDPTLLLTQDEWKKVAVSDRLVKEPYILLFSWNGSKEAVKAAKKVEKLLGCKAIQIVAPPRAMFSGVDRKLDVGPREFLRLIQDAEFVITNSYHGTVFSSIFEKPFLSIQGNTVDARRKTTLEELGLENHLVSYNDITTSMIEEMMSENYSVSKDKIRRKREKSLSLLYEAIGE